MSIFSETKFDYEQAKKDGKLWWFYLEMSIWIFCALGVGGLIVYALLRLLIGV
mgnify:CR=1 FL=1